MIGLFWSLDTGLQCLRQPNDGGAEVDKNYGVILRLNIVKVSSGRWIKYNMITASSNYLLDGYFSG
jgi:hypothetical protein